MVPFAAALTRSVAAFRSEERGAMAMLFASTVMVLGLAVGGSVDYGEASKVQSRLTGAADAASLAGAKLLSEGMKDQAKIIEAVNRHFEANFVAETARGIKHDPLVITMDTKTNAVRVQVTAGVPTAFMKLAGVTRMPIGATSTSQVDNDTIEVAMMLDTTGSMKDSTTDGKIKIAALRQSAAELVDTLFKNVPAGTDRVKIGLAPFAAGVNAGAYARTVSANLSYGCVMERWNAGQDASDESARAFPLRPAGVCPTAPVLPLTANPAVVKARIAGLSTDGSTAGHLGTAWASYLLSPKWADVFPAANTGRAYGAVGNKKIAILMTDGLYNTYRGNLGQDDRSAAAALDLCDDMKARGVTVYTIGFAMNDPAPKKTLATCASIVDGAPAFYDAKDAAALASAYSDIAQRILKIRVSS